MAFVTTLKMKVDVSFLEVGVKVVCRVIRWTILSLPLVSDLEEMTLKMDELNGQRRNLIRYRAWCKSENEQKRPLGASREMDKTLDVVEKS